VNGTATTYTYDANDRLLNEKVGGVVTVAYTYDDNGSTLTKTENGGVTTYVWNDEKRLIQATVGGTVVDYRYNDAGIRVSSKQGGVETRYLLDEGMTANVWEEYGPDGAVQGSYSYGYDLITQTQAGQTSYYLVDGLGSTRLLMDGQGLVLNSYGYEAFGETVSQSGTTSNKYQYAGEQLDGTLGDYYLRQRFYDTSSGRFGRMDNYEGSIENPETLQKYIYANSSPANYIDPTGLFSMIEFSAAESIRNILAGIQIDNGRRLLVATLNGGDYQTTELLKELAIGVAVILLPVALPLAARGMSSAVAGLANLQRKIDARTLANSVEELRLSGTVTGHLADVGMTVQKDGGKFLQLNRPFTNSPLLYQEIMRAKTPIPDPQGVPGALRWDVKGSFRGKDGTWELVVDKISKTVLHFNFVGDRRK
jgi:RHS repeat-associated protein